MSAGPARESLEARAGAEKGQAPAWAAEWLEARAGAEREDDLMARGNRAKIRWAHDRQRKKKDRERRAAAARGAERKAAKRR